MFANLICMIAGLQVLLACALIQVDTALTNIVVRIIAVDKHVVYYNKLQRKCIFFADHDRRKTIVNLAEGSNEQGFLHQLVCFLCPIDCVRTVTLSPQKKRNSKEEEQPVSEEIMPMAEICKLAHIRFMEKNGSEGTRQSLPVPVKRADGLHVLFFYYPAQALAGKPVKIGPPCYLLDFTVSNALFALKVVDPGFFGQSHKVSEPIGVYSIPEGLPYEEMINKMERLYKLYDQLLPHFTQRDKKSDIGIRSASNEFCDLFILLSESALESYYRSVGSEFLDWVIQQQ